MLILPSETNADSKGLNGSDPEANAVVDKNQTKYLFLSVGILVSIGLIFYLFKDLDFKKFKQELSHFNPYFIAPLTLLLALSMVLRAYRVRYLLPVENRKDATFLALLQSVLVGFSANALLPMRAGEIIRPLYLQRRIKLPFVAGLASIFTERIFDLLALLSIAPLLFARIENPPKFLSTTASALGVISVVGVVGLVFCAFWGDFTFRIASQIVTRLLPQKVSDLLLKMLQQVINTIGATKSLRDLSFIVVYSLSIWVITGFYFQLCAQMLGVDISLYAGLLTSVTVAFAVAAPSSPGFIGTFQFGCALTLTTILGYSQEFSLAYGLVVHAIQTGTLLLITALTLSLSGQGLRSAFKQTLLQK